MRKIIIASHGNLSKGMKSSLQMILGPMADPIVTYSLYPGGQADDFADRLSTEIDESPLDEYVIFTDIYGASVCTSMCPLARHPNVVLFAGMNLNLIIELMVSYPNPLGGPAIQSLLTLAREGLRQVTPPTGQVEEDF